MDPASRLGQQQHAFECSGFKGLYTDRIEGIEDEVSVVMKNHPFSCSLRPRLPNSLTFSRCRLSADLVYYRRDGGSGSIEGEDIPVGFLNKSPVEMLAVTGFNTSLRLCVTVLSSQLEGSLFRVRFCARDPSTGVTEFALGPPIKSISKAESLKKRALKKEASAAVAAPPSKKRAAAAVAVSPAGSGVVVADPAGAEKKRAKVLVEGLVELGGLGDEESLISAVEEARRQGDAAAFESLGRVVASLYAAVFPREETPSASPRSPGEDACSCTPISDAEVLSPPLPPPLAPPLPLEDDPFSDSGTLLVDGSGYFAHAAASLDPELF